jgi:diacylglycerol kinase family enzyme
MANIWGKKYFPGFAAYVASILRVLLSFSPRELTITLDGEEHRLKAWLVAVGNAQYFGGGLQVTPNADVFDRLFDVCVVGGTGKLELLRVLPRVFKGAHLDHPAVKVFRASRVTIAGPTELVSQADGEIIGHLPVEFAIADQQLQVILP